MYVDDPFGNRVELMQPRQAVVRTITCLDESSPLSPSEMRAARGRNVLVCCDEIACAHSVAFNVDALPDTVSLSDLEPCLRCSRCGAQQVSIRPIYWTQEPVKARPWPTPSRPTWRPESDPGV